MSWGIVASVGGTIVGGLVSANSAKKAAKTQADAQQRAIDAQTEQFNRGIELQQPAIDAGNTSRNELLYRLGLSPSRTGNATSATPLTRGDLVNTEEDVFRPNQDLYQTNDAYRNAWDGFQREHFAKYNADSSSSRSGQEGYNNLLTRLQEGFSLDDYNAQQAARIQQEQATAQADPTYGNLLQNFAQARANGTSGYDYADYQAPQEFAYKDFEFQADPGYAFRQQQGQQAIDNRAASGGSYFSGAALKAAADFNSGLASQEYGNAYNRYNTSRNQAFGEYTDSRNFDYNNYVNDRNYAYNAYTNDQNNTFNRLASLSGAGQAAANTATNLGQNYAANVGNSITAGGNAQAASQIAQGNAYSGIIGGVTNAFGQYNTLNSLNKGAAAAQANSSSDPIGSLNSYYGWTK